jgi:biopolymer transport protein ExbB/TolQ
MFAEIVVLTSIVSLVGSAVALLKSFQTLSRAKGYVQQAAERCKAAESVLSLADGYSTAAQASAKAAEDSVEKANRAAVSARSHSMTSLSHSQRAETASTKAAESADSFSRTFQQLLATMATSVPKPPRTRNEAQEQVTAENEAREDKAAIAEANRVRRQPHWLNR